jgi:hypothetical protein
MTHHEALERSRRALDQRENCDHKLVRFGPDPYLMLATLWVCPVCNLYLSIDPRGVIREIGPADRCEGARFSQAAGLMEMADVEPSGVEYLEGTDRRIK